MAEKKAAKKMEVTIEGKYVLAVYDIPKSERKALEYRRILQGVHVRVDKSGRWMVEGCDTYKLARVSDGYVGGKQHWFDFTLPPETVTSFKASDILTFEPDAEKGTCKVTRVTKSSITEWVFNLIEGNYPNTDQLIPERIPFGCYRYVHQLSADRLAVLMGAAKKAFGKDCGVVFATQDGKANSAVVGYAEDGPIEMTLLIMPQKLDKHHKLSDATPLDKVTETLRKERDDFKANAEMWKKKALDAENGKADKRNAELEGELVKAKAECDEWKSKALKLEAEAEAAEEPHGADEGRIAELEAELKKARKELDAVWKENEQLKRKAEKAERKTAPESTAADAAKPKADAPAEVTLETMQEWCEGRGLKATQKHPGTTDCIWVHGVMREDTEYQKELTALGFRSKKGEKSSWWFKPAA